MEWDVTHVVETASTNADVAAAARAGAAEGLVIVTDHQTAGRGRLDRRWEAPPGSGLAMSVLVRPWNLPAEQWGWIPLAAGVAAAAAAGAVGAEPVALKWPNDVLLDGRKLGGILVERVETPEGPAAVIGIGLNIAMTADQLPIPEATSLGLIGIDVGTEEVLQHVLQGLSWSCDVLHSDPDGLRSEYLAWCETIGSEVRVNLPDGSILEGEATDVDALGRLIVAGNPVTAGDVVHVRR